jgi:PEP-CTERM motif
MAFNKTLISCFVFAIVGFLGTTCAQADPLLFSNTVALQNGGTRVDLFSNPGITLTGPQVSFLVDITGTLAAGQTDTLLITYSEFGSSPVSQTFQIPAFGGIPPPFSQLFTFSSTNADFVIPSGPNAGQRVDSFTYAFRVAQPVPEPATLVLLTTGLTGIAASIRKRRRR